MGIEKSNSLWRIGHAIAFLFFISIDVGKMEKINNGLLVIANNHT